MHTLEEIIVSRARSGVDNVMKSIETRIQDAVLAAIEILVILGVELAVKSTNACSEQSFDGNVLEPDHRGF